MLRSINQRKRQVNIIAYNPIGRKPWARGFDESKFEFIKDILNDNNLVAKFQSLEPFPDGYVERGNEAIHSPYSTNS